MERMSEVDVEDLVLLVPPEAGLFLCGGMDQYDIKVYRFPSENPVPTICKWLCDDVLNLYGEDPHDDDCCYQASEFKIAVGMRHLSRWYTCNHPYLGYVGQELASRGFREVTDGSTTKRAV